MKVLYLDATGTINSMEVDTLNPIQLPELNLICAIYDNFGTLIPSSELDLIPIEKTCYPANGYSYEILKKYQEYQPPKRHLVRNPLSTFLTNDKLDFYDFSGALNTDYINGLNIVTSSMQDGQILVKVPLTLLTGGGKISFRRQSDLIGVSCSQGQVTLNGTFVEIDFVRNLSVLNPDLYIYITIPSANTWKIYNFQVSF